MQVRLAGAACLALSLGLVAACASQEERRDEHLAAAEQYLEGGQVRAGLIELRNALKLDPKNPDVNFRLAQVLREQGSIGDAAFFYGETARLDPDRLDAVVRQAELLMFDDADRAEELVAGVIERDPSYAEAHMVRSKVALLKTDTETALTEALVAVELEPDNGAYYQQLGKVQQARILEANEQGEPVEDKLYRAALEAFEKASAVSEPGLKYLGHWQRGKVLAAWAGHDEEAAAAYREALADVQHAQKPDVAVSTVIPDTVAFAQARGRQDLLAEALSAWVEESPRNWTGWIGLARLEQERGGDPDAVLQRMLAVAPDDPQVHRQYASFLVQHGRMKEAVAHLEAQADRGIDPPGTLGAVVNFLVSNAELRAQAEPVVQRMERDYPDHPRTWIARAQLDLAEGRTDEAIATLRELTGRSEVPAAYHLLATAEYGNGDLRAALAAVTRAIELDRGGFPHLSVRLQGRLQMELDECAAGIRTMTSLVQHGGGLTAADRTLQAHCLYQLGRDQAARSILKRLIALDPPYLPAAMEFAAQDETRQPEEVRAAFERIDRIRPGSPRVVTVLARMDLREGKPQAALDRINAAIGKSGGASADLLFQRARILAATGDVPGAQRDALRAFEARPDLAGAAAFLVRLYRSQGNESEVVASFEEAHEAGALRPPAVYLLARLHNLAGERARAQELLEEVVAAQPDLLMPKNDLAYFLAEQDRDLDRALELAQTAQQGLPNRPTVADTLGFVYLKRGLNEPALQQFDAALAMSGDEESAPASLHYHRGLALRGLGRDEEAAQAFQQALALDADLEDAAHALDALRQESAAAPDAPASS